ncbi:MAG: hypothetical protein DRJ13_10050 [Bacteroidetes bacterium]|nr:MAG: hypothetical protein DRJ13_10050 [Bacteroidota bacterium]
MPQIWNDLLICSDWDGGIYAYKSSGKTRETVIRKPKFDDTPIYKLEVLSEGLFYALAWDGRIFLYSYNDSKDKTEEQQCFSIENLPVKCIPAGEDFLLADQLNHLFLARQSGEIIEILHSRENILDLVTEQNPEGIICFYESKILRYSIQGKELNSLELEDQILLISHRKEDHWTALITSSHKVIWFSWDTFSFIDSEVMEIPFELRKFQCIYDHNNQNSYLALGMTGDDRLITQEGNKLGLGPDIKFQDFFTNRDGRLLFLNSNGTISMQKNPLPLSYEIKLDMLKASLSGELVLNQHHIIGFTIQNSGEIPACKLRVRLNGASPLRDEVQLLLPGEQLILEFSIKANEVGEAIPLALEMIAEDELGMRWSKVDTLYRESKEA